MDELVLTVDAAELVLTVDAAGLVFTVDAAGLVLTVDAAASDLLMASAGSCLVSDFADFAKGLSAMDGVAEKIIKPASSNDAIIALLLKNDFIWSGLLSDV